MVERYGRIFKISGLLGVCFRCAVDMLYAQFSQGKQLYVTDPKAMHHILVKDQHGYEQTPRSIE